MCNIKISLYHDRQLLRYHGRWNRQPFLAIQSRTLAEAVPGFLRHGTDPFANDF